MNDEITISTSQGVTFVIRVWLLVRHSSFVIRHFEHAC